MRRAFGRALLSPRWWIGAWAATAAVIALLYLAPQTAPPGEYHADKIAHLLAFAALGVPVRLAAPRARGFAIMTGMNAAFALGLELAQSFVPGREFALLDIAANLAGLGLGIMAGLALDSSLGRSWRMRSADFTGAGTGRATRVK